MDFRLSSVSIWGAITSVYLLVLPKTQNSSWLQTFIFSWLLVDGKNNTHVYWERTVVLTSQQNVESPSGKCSSAMSDISVGNHREFMDPETCSLPQHSFSGVLNSRWWRDCPAMSNIISVHQFQYRLLDIVIVSFIINYKYNRLARSHTCKQV